MQSVGVTEAHNIAWVAGRSYLEEQLRLAESVLRDRSSINFRVFSAVPDPKNWLETASPDTGDD